MLYFKLKEVQTAWQRVNPEGQFGCQNMASLSVTFAHIQSLKALQSLLCSIMNEHRKQV